MGEDNNFLEYVISFVRTRFCVFVVISAENAPRRILIILIILHLKHCCCWLLLWPTFVSALAWHFLAACHHPSSPA